MNKTFHWGIIGLGKIAHKFAQDLLLVEDANLYGAASRNIDKATKFCKDYKIDKPYGSYKALLDDPIIDVVYIATPHAFHCKYTLMALESKKAVLCEKAFGMNRQEVEKMVHKAKEKKIFLMEALWTRFIPATVKVINLLNKGVIGNIQTIRADFGFNANFDPKNRLFNKQLGGGSLLDIGIYPVFLSLLILGFPKEIKAIANMSSTDVDSVCTMLFKYANGQTAILDSNLLVSTPTEGWIHGTKGSLKMHKPFHHTKEISYFKDHNLYETFHVDYIGNGYYHEIIEVMNCLREGKTESEKMPLSFSLDLIDILDNVRNEISLSHT